MSDTVIKVEGISKLYRLGEIGTGTLSHDLNRWWHKVRGKEDPYLKIGEANVRSVKSDAEYVWALKDICFEVKRGEVLGIIGRNGAGKSTLLKILSRVTTPTLGAIKVRGRIASLLEVGTGFNPELTGRDNIYLNGAIMGMRKREIDRKFDEIVAFSEVERYIDTPVKRYSSGMYVRLAFAVAAHLEPEILVVDEVLAVGDADFQKKCLGKMQAVSREEGRTVLFVSHNMSAVRTLCDRALLLGSGEVQFLGAVAEAFNQYSQQRLQSAGATWLRPPTLALPTLGFESIRVSLKGTQPQLTLECHVQLRSLAETPRVFIAVDICDNSLVPIMQALPSTDPFIESANGHCNLVMEIDLPPLVPGCYVLDFWIGTHYSKTTDYVKQVATFEVIDSPTKQRSFGHSSEHGFLVPASRCRVHETANNV